MYELRHPLKARKILSVAVVLTYSPCLHIHAESAYKAEMFYDGRCEIETILNSFESKVMQKCYSEANACEESNKISKGNSREYLKELCWRQPLPIDHRYLGPCPNYMKEIEKDTANTIDDVTRKLRLRFAFIERGEIGDTKNTFKGRESYKSIMQYLKNHPDNEILLELLFLYELARDNNQVEVLNLKLDTYERDPDCPNYIYMLPDSIFAYLNRILENHVNGSGSGSNLSEAEIKKLIIRSRDATLSAYEEAIKQNSNTNRSLELSLASVHDPILSGRIEALDKVSEDVGLKLNEYSKKRIYNLSQRYTERFGVNSEHGRSQSLQMMCNDYVFELRLQDHCVNLIKHYSALDQSEGTNMQCDVSQAAIMVLNAATRDCSATEDFWHWHEWWWNDRLCFEESKQNRIDQLNSILARFPENELSADEAILRAYLRLDDSSDDYFLEALAIDDSAVSHASRIGARLLKRGWLEPASKILTQISPEQFGLMTDSEQRLFEMVAQTHDAGSYSNWSELPRITFLKECAN